MRVAELNRFMLTSFYLDKDSNFGKCDADTTAISSKNGVRTWSSPAAPGGLRPEHWVRRAGLAPSGRLRRAFTSSRRCGGIAPASCRCTGRPGRHRPRPPPPAGGGSPFVANLWDGASGVTPDYFNKGALLPWQNRLGDWSDALGVAQGSAAFATGGKGSVGPFTMDVTTLAQWLHANSSYGMFLKARRQRVGCDASPCRSGSAAGVDGRRHQGRDDNLRVRRQRGDQSLDLEPGDRRSSLAWQ